MSKRTRRSFLRDAATTAAGAARATRTADSVPVAATSQDRVAGANRRVRVALIGCAAGERVVGDAEAQKMIDTPYRAPWKRPSIAAATPPTASR